MKASLSPYRRRILVIEDETAIRGMLNMILTMAEFVVDEAETAQQAQAQIAKQHPDLIILDWMLPHTSGMQFAKQLKRHPLTQDIAIIMLTAKAEEDSKIQALQAGADDYITKPFSPRELIARVQAILRRGSLVPPNAIMSVGKLQLNTLTHHIHIENHKIPLTPLEYHLLAFLMMHSDRIYSRNALLTYVWQDQAVIDERTVDALIKRVRKKLQAYDCNHYIHTAHGVGYYFSIAESSTCTKAH